MLPADIMPKLVALALEAGEVTLRYYETGVEVRVKDDRSPVTAADEAAEAVILKGLAALAPGIPVIAEESVAKGNVPEVEGRFWLVDPLDGTKEFIHQRGEFTVNIGLIEDGLPVLGVVVAPAMNAVWWGRVGEGARKRDTSGERAIETRSVPASGAVAVASRSHRDEATNAWLARMGITDTVAAGSSLKFCLVAEGAADWYPRFGPTMEWDTAAGDAVLRAAGGAVRLPDGTPFAYKKPGFRNGEGFVASGRDA